MQDQARMPSQWRLSDSNRAYQMDLTTPEGIVSPMRGGGGWQGHINNPVCKQYLTPRIHQVRNVNRRLSPIRSSNPRTGQISISWRSIANTLIWRPHFVRPLQRKIMTHTLLLPRAMVTSMKVTHSALSTHLRTSSPIPIQPSVPRKPSPSWFIHLQSAAESAHTTCGNDLNVIHDDYIERSYWTFLPISCRIWNILIKTCIVYVFTICDYGNTVEFCDAC